MLWRNFRDKLASKVISKIKEKFDNIEYLSVGGNYLKSLGIRSILTLEITLVRCILTFKLKNKSYS